MTSANLKTMAVSRHEMDLRFCDLQHDEYCADHDTLKTSTEDRVRYDRERLVDYHV